PSEYLRSRCPACFGSGARLAEIDANSPDCVVALDACFTQKHNKQQRDPPFTHARPIMLAEDVLARTAERVEAQGLGRRGRAHATQGGAMEDGLDGIEVPLESLRTCEDSFKAAQESIAKASTAYHDVTVAMALLC
ncbi:hypothetical protein BD626DRAFT_359176, partial [Schizophyllum amplum]